MRLSKHLTWHEGSQAMSEPNEDTKLETLNDHYKDTFAYIQEYRKQRDRQFFLILATITLMLFQVFSPKDAGDTIAEFVSKQLNLSRPIDFSFVSSVIWFILLGLVVRYFQIVVHIERQYDYIHKLEDQLSIVFRNGAFTREGKAYLNNYPMFSRWTAALYTAVFPGVL
jgi:hypothetical protein